MASGTRCAKSLYVTVRGCLLLSDSISVESNWPDGGLWEEKMGTLFFVCPATGIEVSTGIQMELATLQQLELAKIYCPHCRQPHQMAGIEYWLADVQALPAQDRGQLKATSELAGCSVAD